MTLDDDTLPTPTSVAGRAAEPVVALWDRLVCRTGDSDSTGDLYPHALPEAAARWIMHAVAPGTSSARTAVLEMTGQIKVGRWWLPFRATQVISPPEGYVWAARAGRRLLSISGFDRYAEGDGEMRWLLGGHVPIMRASGPDITRSAAGRLASEIVFVPPAFAAMSWEEGASADIAVVTAHLGDEDERAELHLARDGRLLAVGMQRWGNPNGEPFARYPFGATVEDEATFASVTIPSVLRVGYWWGTDRWGEGQFFRAEIVNATFL